MRLKKSNQPLMDDEGVLTPAGDRLFGRLFAAVASVFGQGAVARRSDLMGHAPTRTALQAILKQGDQFVIDLLDEMLAQPGMR